MRESSKARRRRAKQICSVRAFAEEAIRFDALYDRKLWKYFRIQCMVSACMFDSVMFLGESWSCCINYEMSIWKKRFQVDSRLHVAEKRGTNTSTTLQRGSARHGVVELEALHPEGEMRKRKRILRKTRFKNSSFRLTPSRAPEFYAAEYNLSPGGRHTFSKALRIPKTFLKTTTFVWRFMQTLTFGPWMRAVCGLRLTKIAKRLSGCCFDI